MRATRRIQYTRPLLIAAPRNTPVGLPGIGDTLVQQILRFAEPGAMRP